MTKTVTDYNLTHRLCFHLTGALFDKKGNLANWWDETSLAGFLSRERCLVDEYQQYQVLGHHVSHVKNLISLYVTRVGQVKKNPESPLDFDL